MKKTLVLIFCSQFFWTLAFVCLAYTSSLKDILLCLEFVPELDAMDKTFLFGFSGFITALVCRFPGFILAMIFSEIFDRPEPTI